MHFTGQVVANCPQSSAGQADGSAPVHTGNVVGAIVGAADGALVWAAIGATLARHNMPTRNTEIMGNVVALHDMTAE